MGDRAKRNQRKYWREAQKRSRQKRSSENAVLEADTPSEYSRMQCQTQQTVSQTGKGEKKNEKKAFKRNKNFEREA